MSSRLTRKLIAWVNQGKPAQVQRWINAYPAAVSYSVKEALDALAEATLSAPVRVQIARKLLPLANSQERGEFLNDLLSRENGVLPFVTEEGHCIARRAVPVVANMPDPNRVMFRGDDAGDRLAVLLPVIMEEDHRPEPEHLLDSLATAINLGNRAAVEALAPHAVRDKVLLATCITADVYSEEILKRLWNDPQTEDAARVNAIKVVARSEDEPARMTAVLALAGLAQVEAAANSLFAEGHANPINRAREWPALDHLAMRVAPEQANAWVDHYGPEPFPRWIASRRQAQALASTPSTHRRRLRS